MRLGPVIRIIEGLFVLALLSMLGYAMLITGDQFAYDVTLLRVMVMAALSVRAIWLIERRSSSAPTYIVGASALVLVLTVLDYAFGGHVSPDLSEWNYESAVQIAPVAIYVAMLLATMAYFAFSPHVREVFVVDLDAEHAARDIDDEDVYPPAFTWPWVRNLGIYFAVSSIVGHWAEIAFCWLIVLGVFAGDYDFSHAQLWEQWLIPYPAEGLAVVAIVLFLHPLKEWLLDRFGGRIAPALAASFLANAAVCTSIDFLTGITANANYELWDYRDLPFNFMGQIVLQNSLVYSIAATLVVWLLYPMAARALHRAPQHLVNGLFFGLLGFFLFLEALYYVHISPEGIVIG